MFALRPMAVAVELVDKPGGRKTHHGEVPIVGGLAMFLGSSFGMGLLVPTHALPVGMLAAAALLVIVGMLDDRFALSPYARLPAQLVSALLVVVGVGISIQTLGNPFGGEGVFLSGWGSIAFTCVAIVAAINAFNMLDGMDGLAGTAAAVAFAALAALGSFIDRPVVVAISLVGFASVVAFLVFNAPIHINRSVRCFMGDAGSTLLGFVLAYLCIDVSQGSGATISPVATLWLVAVPLYELLWTTVRRLARGVSPFQPDREHFHHLMLDAGFGVRATFGLFGVVAVALAVVGVLLELAGVPDSVSFALWCLAGIGVVAMTYRARALWVLVPVRYRRTVRRENY
jgi:UDP-GlcNAc:undecaprenyl-phosphate GlcNAc-1-phosphate transferase